MVNHDQFILRCICCELKWWNLSMEWSISTYTQQLLGWVLPPPIAWWIDYITKKKVNGTCSEMILALRWYLPWDGTCSEMVLALRCYLLWDGTCSEIVHALRWYLLLDGTWSEMVLDLRWYSLWDGTPSEMVLALRLYLLSGGNCSEIVLALRWYTCSEIVLSQVFTLLFVCNLWLNGNILRAHI